MFSHALNTDDDTVNSRLRGHAGARVEDWDLVMRETHHRMKNTLTLLGASVRREFAHGKSTELSAAVDRFEGRIVAFGKLYQLLAHDGDHLSRDADGSMISVAEYFEDLCAALSKAILEPVGIACEATIESGSLQTGPCTQLALMVTELVTNAAKHAFPDRATGVIRIELVNREGVWCCTVADNGIGPSGALQGVGSRILEGLARTVHARIYASGGLTGTTVRIMMPAPALASATTAEERRSSARVMRRT